jgi:hypothetical protein
MTGFDTSDGYRIEPLDDRDSDDPDFTIDPMLSCSNTDFGGEDPASDPEPRGEVAPAWNSEDRLGEVEG